MADFDGIRIGTRGSPLARWQAEWVADRLRTAHPGLEVVLVPIHTRGDRDRNTPLAQMGGGVGLFTKEIQRAVLEGEADVAVHSLKDLPTERPGGLDLAAVPERATPFDALIAPRFDAFEALPPGARVGTGSIRRKAQLAHHRPDLEIVGLRGNVETRLDQARSGRLDAVVLAEAGLQRLGLDHEITQRLGPPAFLPAVGQGALGIECRHGDTKRLDWLAALDHAPTRRGVLAERACLAELEGGCMIPLAAWGRVEQPAPPASASNATRLRLEAVVLDPEGRQRLFATRTGSWNDPESLGLALAAELRASGAEALLALARPDSRR